MIEDKLMMFFSEFNIVLAIQAISSGLLGFGAYIFIAKMKEIRIGGYPAWLYAYSFSLVLMILSFSIIEKWEPIFMVLLLLFANTYILFKNKKRDGLLFGLTFVSLALLEIVLVNPNLEIKKESLDMGILIFIFCLLGLILFKEKRNTAQMFALIAGLFLVMIMIKHDQIMAALQFSFLLLVLIIELRRDEIVEAKAELKKEEAEYERVFFEKEEMRREIQSLQLEGRRLKAEKERLNLEIEKAKILREKIEKAKIEEVQEIRSIEAYA